MTTTTECSYCHRDVTEIPVPELADDAAWAELAEQHAADCEWVLTRAYRRPIPYPNETPKVRSALLSATSLEDLRDLFPRIEDATDLPTFGGEAPATGTDEVWSWDAERLLVGVGDDVRIVYRAEWARQVERARVQARIRELRSMELTVETNEGTHGEGESHNYSIMERVGDGQRHRVGANPSTATGRARYLNHDQLRQLRAELDQLQGVTAKR